MDRETQFLQTVLDFRTAHKQTPQKARTVILDHRGDRTLVYRQICLLYTSPSPRDRG